MLTHRPSAGFSIIELMTAIAIMGLLIALGMPTLATYIQTARLGTAARSFYTGVQLARSQAIQLNQRVDFVQTSSTTLDFNSVPDAAGGSWVVRYTDASGVPQVVDRRSVLEGAGATPSVVASGTASTITFNSLGATAASSVIAVQPVAANSCAPVGSTLCWNVVVSPGGQVRLCNPSVPSAALDSRGC